MYFLFELERYEVRGFLGRGAEADVYLLWDKRMRRYVAAKVCNDVRMAKRQGEMMKSFGPMVCPECYEIEERGEQAVIYMEYVEGETLEAYRKRKGLFSQEEAVAVLLRLIDVLCYVHQRGVVYLDNKPSNIIIRPSGQLCLVDFGASKRIGAALGKRGGTYGYAAPEQFWNVDMTDERSDVYACGKLLIFLLTEKDPSHPPYDDLCFTTRLPLYLQKIIANATSCDVRLRYRNLYALKQELYEGLMAHKRRIFRKKPTNCIICEKSIWKSDYLRE